MNLLHVGFGSHSIHLTREIDPFRQATDPSTQTGDLRERKRRNDTRGR